MTDTSVATADLYDERGEDLASVSLQFQSLGGHSHFSGPVRTIKCFEDNSRVKELAELDGSGKVLVVDGGGSLRCALLGDMIAERAAHNGWHGVVIYGCIRDVDMLAQTDLGVQALASHPLRSNRRGAGDLDLAVTFGGVTFRPGEYVYADNNGIIVSPSPLKMPE